MRIKIAQFTYHVREFVRKVTSKAIIGAVKTYYGDVIETTFKASRVIVDNINSELICDIIDESLPVIEKYKLKEKLETISNKQDEIQSIIMKHLEEIQTEVLTLTDIDKDILTNITTDLQTALEPLRNRVQEECDKYTKLLTPYTKKMEKTVNKFTKTVSKIEPDLEKITDKISEIFEN